MAEFNECKKRQREIYKGVERHRCIERTSEHFRDFVHPDACAACPVRKFTVQKKEVKKEQPNKGTMVQLPVLNNPGDEYPDCIYRICNGGDCECSVTSHAVDPDICRRCDEEVRDKTAGNLLKIKNYWGAVRRWIAHGRPVRTDKEMRHLFETYCKKCDRYDPVAHACTACGCKVNQDSKPLANKLKMATESCPMGLFPAKVGD